MSEEIWRRVVGWEDLYEVSDQGRVRSRRKILSPARCPQGYLKVTLCSGGSRATKKVHVLVAAAFLDRKEGSALVRHLDGDKNHNDVGNLCFGTYRENAADMVVHGTAQLGELNHKAILTSRDVHIIRSLKHKLSARQVALLFGVAGPTIGSIFSGKNWKHLPWKADCAVLDTGGVDYVW